MLVSPNLFFDGGPRDAAQVITGTGRDIRVHGLAVFVDGGCSFARDVVRRLVRTRPRSSMTILQTLQKKISMGWFR